MKNWEEVYESYKNGDMKQHYEQLQEKLNAKMLNAEEYKEFQKMTKVMENLPKVENIMIYKDKLETDYEILKEEYVNARELEENMDKQDKNLDKEIEKNLLKQEALLEEKKKITKRIYEIDEKLRTEKETLTDEEKEKLNSEKADLNTKKVGLDTKLSDLSKAVDENNKQFSKNRETVDKIEKRKELKDLTKAQIRRKCFKTSSLISKCNFVAGKLMEGQSRESLEIALKDWKDRKFTSKTPLPLSRKERRKEEATKEKPVQEEPIKKEPVEEKIFEGKPIEKESTEEKLFNDEPKDEEHSNKEDLVEVSEFEKRFPRLSKFLPKFFKKSRIATSIANLGKNNEDKEEVEPEEISKKDLDKEPDEIHKTDTEEKLEKKEDKEQNYYKDKKQKFRDYVRYDIDILEVADKGIDQIDTERRKQKLENAQKQARKHDEEVHGYGDR